MVATINRRGECMGCRRNLGGQAYCHGCREYICTRCDLAPWVQGKHRAGLHLRPCGEQPERKASRSAGRAV